MAQKPIVTLDGGGQLLGKTCASVRGGDYFSFQGIPYAKPPVGDELRFKAPQPPESWSGIREATSEGSACYSRRPLFRNVIGSDDCLYLNVYTPQLPDDARALKPVMVWIHGGGFMFGSGSSEFYGPDFLIVEDVVLVTINYRLGLFGFLAFEDESLGVPGNAGFKDQVMALTWVQKNIKQFGGNPDNVTLFGNSAGSASIHCMLLSPMSKGLFHKAICQSGTVFSSWVKGQYSVSLIAKALNLDTIDEAKIFSLLKEMPSDKIFELQEKIPNTFVASEIRPFGLVLEKNGKEPAFLAEDPSDIVNSGRYNEVPLMMGFTSREGILLEVLSRNADGKIEFETDFEKAIPHELNLRKGSEKSRSAAEKIEQFYYGREQPAYGNIDRYYQLNSDIFFFRSIYDTVKLHLIHSSTPIYFYRISVESQLNFHKQFYGIRNAGVCHADEIGYLFRNVTTPEICPGTIEDVSMKRFAKLWTAFARTGNPNPEHRDETINITWSPVQKGKFHYLDIGENLTVGINPEAARMAFWDRIYELNPKNC